jgi:hypothetical protein
MNRREAALGALASALGLGASKEQIRLRPPLRFYQTKPVKVEAIQFDGMMHEGSVEGIIKFLRGTQARWFSVPSTIPGSISPFMVIMRVDGVDGFFNPGDWIVWEPDPALQVANEYHFARYTDRDFHWKFEPLT